MNTRSHTAPDSVDAPPTHRIVVGYDGSQPAASTIEWAAAEAAARGASLRVVACLAAPATHDYYGTGARQREQLANVVEATRQRHPHVLIDAASTHMDPQDALLDEASDADLLIVGASGSSGVKRMLLGSVPRTAVRRSSCPVIVVRGHLGQPVRRIVAGIDSSNAAAQALDWAADAAVVHGADLTVVHAWQRGSGPGRSRRDNDLEETDAQCVLDLAVRRCEERTGRPVRGQLVEGEPGAVLTAASNDADLLAVGSRGRSGFRTMFYGSVAVSALDHAGCPVAVLHPSPAPETHDASG